METTTYYNHEIELNQETGKFEFALSGWVYEEDTLQDAKKIIKENWRESTYFYNHCC